MSRTKLKYSVGSIALGVIASFVYDGIKHVPILTGLKTVFLWIWNHILNLEVRLWLVMVILIAVYFVYKVVSGKSGPEFTNYREDQFDGFTWTWDWYLSSSSRKWQTKDITPLCPECKTTMHYWYGALNCYQANCPRCGYQVGRIKPREDIDALIIDNLRRRDTPQSK